VKSPPALGAARAAKCGLQEVWCAALRTRGHRPHRRLFQPFRLRSSGRHRLGARSTRSAHPPARGAEMGRGSCAHPDAEPSCPLAALAHRARLDVLERELGVTALGATRRCVGTRCGAAASRPDRGLRAALAGILSGAHEFVVETGVRAVGSRSLRIPLGDGRAPVPYRSNAANG